MNDGVRPSLLCCRSSESIRRKERRRIQRRFELGSGETLNTRVSYAGERACFLATSAGDGQVSRPRGCTCECLCERIVTPLLAQRSLWNNCRGAVGGGKQSSTQQSRSAAASSLHYTAAAAGTANGNCSRQRRLPSATAACNGAAVVSSPQTLPHRHRGRPDRWRHVRAHSSRQCQTNGSLHASQPYLITSEARRGLSIPDIFHKPSSHNAFGYHNANGKPPICRNTSTDEQPPLATHRPVQRNYQRSVSERDVNSRKSHDGTAESDINHISLADVDSDTHQSDNEFIMQSSHTKEDFENNGIVEELNDLRKRRDSLENRMTDLQASRQELTTRLETITMFLSQGSGANSRSLTPCGDFTKRREDQAREQGQHPPCSDMGHVAPSTTIIPSSTPLITQPRTATDSARSPLLSPSNRRRTRSGITPARLPPKHAAALPPPAGCTRAANNTYRAGGDTLASRHGAQSCRYPLEPQVLRNELYAAVDGVTQAMASLVDEVCSSEDDYD